MVYPNLNVKIFDDQLIQSQLLYLLGTIQSESENEQKR